MEESRDVVQKFLQLLLDLAARQTGSAYTAKLKLVLPSAVFTPATARLAAAALPALSELQLHTRELLDECEIGWKGLEVLLASRSSVRSSSESCAAVAAAATAPPPQPDGDAADATAAAAQPPDGDVADATAAPPPQPDGDAAGTTAAEAPPQPDGDGAGAIASLAVQPDGSGTGAMAALAVQPDGERPRNPAAARPLTKFSLTGGLHLKPLTPQLVANLAACTSLHHLHLEWRSAPPELLRQLGSLTQLTRLRIGTIPFQQVSELRPLTNLVELDIFQPTGVAVAADFTCFPSLRRLVLESGLMDARGLEALTSLTYLSISMLLGPEHIAALPADYDGYWLPRDLSTPGGAGFIGALPPLQLPLPSYPLPPKLVQLWFDAPGQFVEVLAALAPPDSLRRALVLDGNITTHYLQLPLLHGRHTTADLFPDWDGEGDGGEGGWPALLPAVAQAVARFAQQLGRRWLCSDLRISFVPPEQGDDEPWQLLERWVLGPPRAAAGAGAAQQQPQQQHHLLAPGGHGAWLSPLAAMPELGGLWLQGLALTAADLLAIGTAFTGIRTLSLLGSHRRCCPYPALRALGPLLPRLRVLRLDASPLMLPPPPVVPHSLPVREWVCAKRGVAAACIAALYGTSSDAAVAAAAAAAAAAAGPDEGAVGGRRRFRAQVEWVVLSWESGGSAAEAEYEALASLEETMAQAVKYADLSGEAARRAKLAVNAPHELDKADRAAAEKVHGAYFEAEDEEQEP
ncbi:hypothetical protein HYH02_007053 [Chlamydomonas schloesseri]|uniref:Uncharacterized protein n=1 Tax=Chlamydomonas schloesseri TaxID=2026947 RepID=A0A836B571_9CHLO|nr:hypothetical protein HYH02_007053 [Chlamydomonas schloesseri]|eukprot:KAG2448026.1 hypothetical protein HYH02_007053 [Chlamydomonas schloesseri]